MTEDEMYEHVRSQMRKGVPALEALSKTLIVAGSEIKPFYKGEEHLYVRCDNMPPHSIKIIDFLATANFLTWRIKAFVKSAESKEAIAYMHIYKGSDR